MIYLTGDTHKDVDIHKLFTSKIDQLTKEDYLIILGDFGFPFLDSDISDEILMNDLFQKEREIYQYYITLLARFPFTILFIDGNHDNHAYWAKQPVISKFGGKVQAHKDAKNIFHLLRGEYYNIDGFTFFCMGGAVSIDKAMRIKDLTWWEEEVPSYKEMEHGIDNLIAHNYQVDFILTHAMPHELIPIVLHQYYQSDEVTRYLDMIYHNTDYQYWFCGHYHEEIRNEYVKMQVLYNKIVCLNDYLKIEEN